MTLSQPATVTVRHRFKASATRVFDAWLDPRTAGTWLFATPTGCMVKVEIDARVGGAFTIIENRDGEDIEHTGHYLEIDRPRRLVFAFSVPKFSSESTKVTIEIVELKNGCELALTHEGVLPDYASRTQEGWTKMLHGLSEQIEGAARATKVFGHPISVTTRHVLMALAEKGLDAEFISIDVFQNEQKQPAHLVRQPFGHIPVIEDGAFKLYETPAILRYIENRWPDPPLTPATLEDKAFMDQWLCIEQAYLQPAMQKVIARKGAEGFGKPDPGPAIVDEGRSELATIFDVMAQHLSRRSYLAGERFSLADLVWLAYFPYARDAGAGDLIAARARVSDWWRRVENRPSLATALNKLGVKPG